MSITLASGHEQVPARGVGAAEDLLLVLGDQVGLVGQVALEDLAPLAVGEAAVAAETAVLKKKKNGSHKLLSKS